MHFVDRHREKIRQSPMSSRLLWACLLLVVLLVLTFGAALFLFASLHNTKKDISRSLQIQFSVFQNDMERYFDQLAVMGVNLSEDMGALVDRQLASREMTFDQLNDSPEVLNALEEEMIEPLCRSLRRTSCSGAFVLLDATVNTRMEGAGYSRAGLYVQKGGADTPTVPLLLYRGSADVGKTHSVMPHHTVRTRTRFFTKKGSGTFFVYRRFCGRTTRNGKRAKAGYHYDSGILPFALRNQVRFVRTWSSPYMARLGVVAAYVRTGSLYTSDKV